MQVLRAVSLVANRIALIAKQFAIRD